jgi:hypothetical protein
MSYEFVVDLVSNACMETYPNNTLSKFTNRLPCPLNLNGEWTVGIQEIFYPTSYSITSKTVKFSLFYGGQYRLGKYEMTYNETDDVTEICMKINDVLKAAVPIINADYPPDFRTVEGKVALKAGWQRGDKILPYFLDNEFLVTLGWTLEAYAQHSESLFNSDHTLLLAKNDPKSGIKSHLLFVYTDIVTEHFVGDHSARLLRVLPLQNDSKIANVTFMKPFYYPVRLNRIENINILLCDENGSQIKFETGRVYISLHFVKK